MLLLEVEVRTSAKGTTYHSGWLGKARLVGFESDEWNGRGRRVIKFYAEESWPQDAGPAGRRG